MGIFLANYPLLYREVEYILRERRDVCTAPRRKDKRYSCDCERPAVCIRRGELREIYRSRIPKAKSLLLRGYFGRHLHELAVVRLLTFVSTSPCLFVFHFSIVFLILVPLSSVSILLILSIAPVDFLSSFFFFCFLSIHHIGYYIFKLILLLQKYLFTINGHQFVIILF